MKFSHWMFVFFLMAPVVASAQNELPGKGPAEAPLKALRDKTSYGIGLNIAASLRSQGAEVDPRLLVRGLLDALEGRKPLLTNAELRTVMTNYGAEMEAKQIAAAKAAGGKNRQAGIAFLEANKKKPGVIVLPSGLQYKILKRGTGRTPKASDTVTTHYHGTLIDGTVFDSSYERKQPASFPVNGVIRGWTEALQLMKTGDKWQLFIPSELAYGANPRPGGPIGPHAVLIFDIELLKVQ